MVEERTVRQVYARMWERSLSFAEAASELGLRPAETAQVRARLAELGLLDPGAEVAVDAMAALRRMLAGGEDLLGRLAEQRAASRALTDYVSLTGGDNEHVRVDFYPGTRTETEAMRTRLRAATARSTEEIMSMHPPYPWHRWSPKRLARSRAEDAEAVGRGVRVRNLHTQGQLHVPLAREHIQGMLDVGVEVRTSAVVPVRMIVIDRVLAVVEAVPGDIAAGALLIEGRLLVASLAALFDYCWMTAAEPKDVPRAAVGDDLTEQQRAVLRLLASGSKDDAIARALGVSPRTVTRVVGELTALLGAGSRFQAGVRAAKLGLT
ncbi:helix-turn-helix transcriptional regulator [Nonomuraea sp. NPDC050310]|uniref:helix-turn-helix transcriptional regulator n=1 Tax=unclassified Nonomuraea TaxID=2593643 RepID=UPI0033C34D88